VIVGAFVSVTLIVLVAVAVLPDVSVAVYVRIYVPLLVKTVPVMVTVTDGSHVSVADAPGSTYPEPHSTVIGLTPFKVITGGVPSTTLTVLVTVAVLPELSVAV
jgi:hypothetical protein